MRPLNRMRLQRRDGLFKRSLLVVGLLTPTLRKQSEEGVKERLLLCSRLGVLVLA